MIDFQADLPALQAVGVNTDGVRDAFFGGSRVICNPAPEDTDCDIVILVKNISHFEHGQTLEWESPSSSDYEGDQDTFKTFRNGEYNLMVFDDPTEYGAVKGATALAQHLNIQDKAKRYALFEKMRSPWR